MVDIDKTEFALFSKKVTIVSYIMALGIVIYHLGLPAYFGLNLSQGIVDKVCKGIYDILDDVGPRCVSFFMTCSAFLLYYNMTKENTLDKIYRRIHTLFVPFVLWNIIGIIWGLVYWWGTNNFEAFVRNVPFQFAMSYYCGVMWFNEALLFFLLFIPIIYFVMKKRVLGECVLLIAFACGYMEWEFLKPNILTAAIEGDIDRFMCQVPMYLLGAYLGIRFPDKIILEKYNSVLIKLAAIVASIVPWFLPKSFITYLLIMFRPVFLWIVIDKRWLRFEVKWWMQTSFLCLRFTIL